MANFARSVCRGGGAIIVVSLWICVDGPPARGVNLFPDPTDPPPVGLRIVPLQKTPLPTPIVCDPEAPVIQQLDPTGQFFRVRQCFSLGIGPGGGPPIPGGSLFYGARLDFP